MNKGPSAIALAVAAVVVGVTVWLLVSGGTTPSADDPAGDVVVSRGPKPPTSIELADLTRASAEIEERRAIFEATSGADIPTSLDNESITWRWEVEEDGQVTWIVSASVNVERTASLVATQFDHSSFTEDGSLPGHLDVEGNLVRVTLELEELQEFPEEFTWTMTTTLDGDRVIARSAVAEDRVPDEGSLDSGSQ